MAQCTECGFDNRAGVLFCEECGMDVFSDDFANLPTKKLPTNRLRPSPYGSTVTLQPIILTIRGRPDAIVLERTGFLTIGRTDPKAPDVNPDVDLQPFGADEAGVSRNHVRVAAADNPPTITDLGSANGTFVNGQKLIPDRPQAIHDGDEIRFGRLIARVRYL